ncbi:MAG: hypothetical protein II230_01220 [Clostridia bacterium]|nr:hypothetical protein [Clostridia bacterium]
MKADHKSFEAMAMNLIVRVGGYSARFITLSEDIQNEIMNRIRHSCC